jgi:hypothetical protein
MKRMLKVTSFYFHLLVIGDLAARLPPTQTNYELLEQERHHEIECFFNTTFKSIGTSPYRGTAVVLPIEPGLKVFPYIRLWTEIPLKRFHRPVSDRGTSLVPCSRASEVENNLTVKGSAPEPWFILSRIVRYYFRLSQTTWFSWLRNCGPHG